MPPRSLVVITTRAEGQTQPAECQANFAPRSLSDLPRTSVENDFWLEFSGIFVSYGLRASQNPEKFPLKSRFPRLQASIPTVS